MKIIKVIFGVLFGLYAAAMGVGLLVNILTGHPISEILGNLCGLCIGAAVSIVLFGSAMKTKVEQKEEMIKQ